MRVVCVVGTLAAVAGLSMVGCGSSGASDPVAGTAWRLLSIESMTSEQPTTTIADPAKYTVAFGDDGQAVFQIDCNRGSGTFQTAAAAPDSGSLTFGPIALTRMFCPRPSHDSEVAAALGNVRTYLLSNGQLHLSLMADGGIMHWEPQTDG